MELSGSNWGLMVLGHFSEAASLTLTSINYRNIHFIFTLLIKTCVWTSAFDSETAAEDKIFRPWKVPATTDPHSVHLPALFKTGHCKSVQMQQVRHHISPLPTSFWNHVLITTHNQDQDQVQVSDWKNDSLMICVSAGPHRKESMWLRCQSSWYLVNA